MLADALYDDEVLKIFIPHLYIHKLVVGLETETRVAICLMVSLTGGGEV